MTGHGIPLHVEATVASPVTPCGADGALYRNHWRSARTDTRPSVLDLALGNEMAEISGQIGPIEISGPAALGSGSRRPPL